MECQIVDKSLPMKFSFLLTSCRISYFYLHRMAFPFSFVVVGTIGSHLFSRVETIFKLCSRKRVKSTVKYEYNLLTARSYRIGIISLTRPIALFHFESPNIPIGSFPCCSVCAWMRSRQIDWLTLTVGYSLGLTVWVEVFALSSILSLFYFHADC